MNHEVVKNQDGKFDLIVDGQMVKTYTRKADAKRGYLRMVGATTAATGAAQGTMTRDKHSEKTSQFVMVNGKLKEIPLRQGYETAAHIDTLMQLRRVKTDKQDAKLIAQYCQKEQPDLWQPETDQKRRLKNLRPE